MTPDDLEQAELVEMALYGAGTGYEKTLAVEVLRLRAVVERLEKVEAAARAVKAKWHESNWIQDDTRDYAADFAELLDALARELARPAGEDGGT